MKREALRLIGGLLFVLVLNGFYTLAEACEGDYPAYVPPQGPDLVCTAC